jgi:HAD superfamily hydrolase (TIGR01549 family)
VPIRAYLFDYGGTLDGEGRHWFDRSVELQRRAGSTIAEPEMKRAFYAADARLALEAAERRHRLRPMIERHAELQAEVLGDPFRRIAPAFVDGFVAITEEGWRAARALFVRLRPHARLGVVSNFYGNLETVLEEAGLAASLEVVVESAAVGVEKPDPAIYRIALERLALPAHEVAMVGDHFERDVRVAKSLGLRAIWLRRGDREPPEPGVADAVVSSLAEIAPGIVD